MGDANKDHACWERPEDMDTPNSVFKIDINTPSFDVAMVQSRGISHRVGES